MRLTLSRGLSIAWAVIVWTTTLVIVAFVVVLVFALMLASAATDKPQR